MKIQFDKNQPYQLKAIQTVVDLFKGQPLLKNEVAFSNFDPVKTVTKNTQAITANELQLTDTTLLENLNFVQTLNNLSPNELSTHLIKLSYNDESVINDSTTTYNVITHFPNYAIEMETGTGKTYVYLRTIYELNKAYNFKKFVIVVPSLAIREGVLKSLQITSEHFQNLYNNHPTAYKVYDANKLTELQNYANSNILQILVINIDSFTKHANIINQLKETGLKPIEYIQKCKPIVIIDEPQNMETDIRKKAIANLNPMCTLRYSATHKNSYNLIYKLDPVKAYDLGLVKQIEVDSVIAKNDQSNTYISVDCFKKRKQTITATVTIQVNEKTGLVKKQVIAKIGDDIYKLSKGYSYYETGFVINELDVEMGVLKLSNGMSLVKGVAQHGLTNEILKKMIDATVENHIKKELQLSKLGIKVLSLFFVDKVANYRSYDDMGNAIKGKFALWFEESYAKWQKMPAYKNLLTYHANEIHNGYFSQDKGKLKDTKEGKATKADEETYKLIMQDKERLLDIKTPLRFIFSHSALREGWDNPNVFQICTLNETKSTVKKRQEIGRGLRLCVNQTGARNMERPINRLTIIANEAYDTFAKALQKEIEEDCGVTFEGRIKNVRNREKVILKNNWQNDVLFKTLWQKIKYKTEYKITYDTSILIKKCKIALQAMPTISKPAIYREKNTAKFNRNRKGNLTALSALKNESSQSVIENISYKIPDYVAYIQAKTSLTRKTITQIILQSKRLCEIYNNPQLYIDTVTEIIKQELDKLKIEGIQYETNETQEHALNLFETTETEQYRENLVAVKQPHKTIYNYITINPQNVAEKKFAEACDSNEDILFYLKLPTAYSINTPVGNYSPTWAIVKKDQKTQNTLYYIAETTGTNPDKKGMQINDKQRLKRLCAQKHYASLNSILYRVLATVSELP